MLNTYRYSSGGLAATYLAGALLYYAFTNPSVSTISTKALRTLESSKHRSSQLMLDSETGKGNTEFDITHRGSGRIVPIYRYFYELVCVNNRDPINGLNDLDAVS